MFLDRNITLKLQEVAANEHTFLLLTGSFLISLFHKL